ncbi:hypothetical protein BX265_1471 [Streptomyces sp. TLI_235]|nr:hypothetical protein [Streptomyces sp. TLI_235]PBC76750.1 hypothetical protein BX265_1471 [Streptomyces sp. TLI_235]
MPPVLSHPRTVVTALAVSCGLAVSWLSGLHGTATKAATEATADTYTWSNARVDGGGRGSNTKPATFTLNGTSCTVK